MVGKGVKGKGVEKVKAKEEKWKLRLRKVVEE